KRKIPMKDPENKEEFHMWKVLYEEIQNTAKSYDRILNACGGKDKVLDSIIITAMAANSSLSSFAMNQQNIAYEKVVELNRKIVTARGMGVLVDEKDSEDIDILSDEINKIINKAIKNKNS